MMGTSAVNFLVLRASLKESVTQGRETVGRCGRYFFRSLSDIIEDRDALAKLLKTIRHGIAAYAKFKGHHSTLARIDADWEVAINLLEGVGFISAINTLFSKSKAEKEKYESMVPVKDTESKLDLLGRVADWTGKATTIAFCTADIVGGVLWMLTLEIPVLGPFSEVKRVVVVIGKIADGAALTGFISDGISAINKLRKFDKLCLRKQQKHLLRLGENTTAAVAIIFGFAGVTFAPLTIGFGFAASGLGIVRFLHKRPNE